MWGWKSRNKKNLKPLSIVASDTFFEATSTYGYNNNQSGEHIRDIASPHKMTETITIYQSKSNRNIYLVDKYIIECREPRRGFVTRPL